MSMNTETLVEVVKFLIDSGEQRGAKLLIDVLFRELKLQQQQHPQEVKPRLIPAIKRLREETDLGLKEAKDLTEELWAILTSTDKDCLQG